MGIHLLSVSLCLQSDDSRDGVGRNFGSEEKTWEKGFPKRVGIP